MSMATEKRSLDPEQVHQIWTTIISLLKQPSDDTTATSTQKSLSSVSINSLSSLLKGDKTENASNSKKSSDAAELIIQQAIKEGLLVISSLSNGEGLTNGVSSNSSSSSNSSAESFVSLPLADGSSPTPSRTPTNGFAPHDWYCFGCHVITGKQLIECNSCWRVYHSACVQTDHDFAVKLELDSQVSDDSPNLVIRARNFTCPVCTLTAKFEKFTIGSRLLSQTEFNQILSYAFTAFRSRASQISRNLLKLKEFAKIPLSDSSLSSTKATSLAESSSSNSTTCELNTQLALQYLSYKSVDLAEIENKLAKSEYQTMGEFLGDCLSFKHMIEVAVVAGTESEHSRRRISDTLNRMLESCRYDLKEMLGCIDCYRNSNRNQEDKFWFCRPCDPPHMLVFARQKGYPYWPAKVINPRKIEDVHSGTQYDVRFFGSKHERCLIIAESDIKDINSSLVELCIQKANPSLEKALAELRVHRELLEKYEKGLDTDINPEDHVDGHKVVSKRAINRRPSLPSVKKQTGSNSSSKPDEPSTKVNKSKNSKARSRSNTAESEATIPEEKVESEDEGKASEQQVASEQNSEDMFEDAQEKLSEEQNIVENNVDKAHSDTDEKMTELKDVDDAPPVAKKPRRTIKKKKSADDDDEEARNTQSESNKFSVEEEDSNSKRPRGRPRKYFPSPDEHSNATSKKGRVRKSKVLYSPVQTFKISKLASSAASSASPSPEPEADPLPTSTAPPVRVSSRGRKQKAAFDRSPSPLRISVSTVETSLKSSISPRGRPRGSGRNATSSSISSSRSSIRALEPNRTCSRVVRKLSLSPSPVRKVPEKKANEKAQRRKQNIERQRQLIAERRKKTQKGSTGPKHIPPVTATKSSPAFSGTTILDKSITSPVAGRSQLTPNLQKVPFTPHNHFDKKPLLNHPPSSAQFSSPSGFNSPLFSFASQNGFINSAQMFNIPQQSAHLPPPPSLPFQPQTSSFSKTLPKRDEITNGKATSSKLVNGAINGSNESMDEESTSKEAESNNLPDDDDDDEPYLYDDDQLEEQINEYVTYQEEKEQFEKVQKEQWFRQQQFFQQQQMFRQMQLQQQQQQVALQNGTAGRLSKMPPPSPGKSKFLLGPAPKAYLEYSSSCIYAPTKTNQNLVNHYLHQYSINNASIPPSRSDYLAKLVLRKDEFEQMDQAQSELEQSQPTRKRGRPPKSAADDVFERSGKAKSIVEKSYLQESSCDRNCLMKNVKTFKRFRDFVENQKKDDISKMKKELEQLKQEVYRLKNAKEELEGDLKREQENNKRLDPQLLCDLEERHKTEVSKIKRKQWCIICESEASFFCCPSTSYCSPECQHKHWFSGHSSKCNRHRINNSNNPIPLHRNNAIKH